MVEIKHCFGHKSERQMDLDFWSLDGESGLQRGLLILSLK